MTTPFTKLIEETEKEIENIKKKLKIRDSPNMTEICLICRKEQEVNEPYTIYEEEGFALCEKCENNKDVQRAFDNGRLFGMLNILQRKQAEKIFNETLEKIKERLNNTLNKWEYCDNCGNQLSCGCEEADNYNLMRKEINSVISEFQSPHTCLGENKDLSLAEGSIPSADTLNSMEKKE